MTFESDIPKILLRHIRVADWGERRAAMLRLVGELSIPGYCVKLDPIILEAMGGRSRDQARYDHDVLVELATERFRVLRRRRLGGKQPDAWEIRPLPHWRNVPFYPSRAQVLSLFVRDVGDTDVALMWKRPGQGLAVRGDGVDLRGGGYGSMSVKPPMWHPHDHASTPQPERELDPQSPLNTTPSPGSLLIPGIKTSSYVDDDDGRGSLVEAVRQTIGASWIRGTPARELEALAAQYSERLDELIAMARVVLRQTKAPSQAVIVLREAAAKPIWPTKEPEPVRPCSRCSGTGFYFDADGDKLPCFHAAKVLS